MPEGTLSEAVPQARDGTRHDVACVVEVSSTMPSPSARHEQRMLDRALRVLMGNLQEVADEAGAAYSTLHAWADARRNPSRENLIRHS